MAATANFIPLTVFIAMNGALAPKLYPFSPSNINSSELDIVTFAAYVA